MTLNLSKTLEVWLSECMVRITPEPISSMSPSSTEWKEGLWISGAQAYPAFKGQYGSGQYANLSFEGLREWWLKNGMSMSPEELPELVAATQWYPLHWLSVTDGQSPNDPKIWDWYRLGSEQGSDSFISQTRPDYNPSTLDDHVSLSPYDVLSIPLDTLLDAVHLGNPINIGLWNTNGLTVVVRSRAADRYHPELQVLLD